MKDIPLYKEGDDLIAFITSFTLYLNYYDIDPTIKIKEEGEAGYVSAEGSAKELKKHYTNPKTLLGRALQGQVSSWYLDNIQAKPITCKEEWAEVIKLFQTEFALDGQTQLGRVVKWHRLSTDKYPTFMEFIHEVQKTGQEAGIGEDRQVELIKSLADNEQIAAIHNQNAKTVMDIIQAIWDMKTHAQNVKKTESPAFMKINVNKKLEEQTTKLDEIITMLAKLSLNDGDDTAQAYCDQSNGSLWQRDSGSYQNQRGAPYRGNFRGGSHRGYRGNNWRGRNNRYHGGFNGGCGQRWNDFCGQGHRGRNNY